MKGVSTPPVCRVDIYKDSFENGPTTSFETQAAPAWRLGDLIDPGTWPEAGAKGLLAAKNIALRITAVNQLTWQMGNAQTGRSLGICVEVVARPQ